MRLRVSQIGLVRSELVDVIFYKHAILHLGFESLFYLTLQELGPALEVVPSRREKSHGGHGTASGLGRNYARCLSGTRCRTRFAAPSL